MFIGDDKAILRMVANDQWRLCNPADLARLTAMGWISCGCILTNRGRRKLDMPALPNYNLNRGGVLQYAK